MRAEGGDIKTAQERRMMADRKRFKQHREFKEKLEENPKERMRKPRNEEWEDRRDSRKDFKKGRSDRRDSRKEGGRDFERRDKKTFERGDKKTFDRGGKKPFDRNKGGNKKFGKRHFDDDED